MVRTCVERRNKWLERFKALGPPKVGREEREWKSEAGTAPNNEVTGTS